MPVLYKQLQQLYVPCGHTTCFECQMQTNGVVVLLHLSLDNTIPVNIEMCSASVCNECTTESRIVLQQHSELHDG